MSMMLSSPRKLQIIASKIVRKRPFVYLSLLTLLFCSTVGLEAGEGASRVNEVFVRLKENPQTSSEKLLIRQQELNDFFAVVFSNRPQLGLRNVAVQLLSEASFIGTATVDMDKIQVGGWGTSLFKTFLSGEQELKARGKFIFKSGKGSYQLEEASFNGISVPIFLVNSVLSFLAERYPPHIDISEPFDLPYNLKDVQITQGQIELIR